MKSFLKVTAQFVHGPGHDLKLVIKVQYLCDICRYMHIYCIYAVLQFCRLQKAATRSGIIP